MMTLRKASPATSTPPQKLSVPKRTLRGVLSGSRSVPSAVLVALPGEPDRAACDAVAQALRARGVPTEVAATPQRFGKQIRYAERRGIPFVWFPGADGAHEVRDIRSGEQVPADPAAWLPPTDDLRPQVILASNADEQGDSQ
jgi:histidyl-tRNA synthetase